MFFHAKSLQKHSKIIINNKRYHLILLVGLNIFVYSG